MRKVLEYASISCSWLERLIILDSEETIESRFLGEKLYVLLFQAIKLWLMWYTWTEESFRSSRKEFSFREIKFLAVPLANILS